MSDKEPTDEQKIVILAAQKICHTLVNVASEFFGQDRSITEKTFNISSGDHEDSPCIQVSLKDLGNEAIIIPVQVAMKSDSDTQYYEELKELVKIALDRMTESSGTKLPKKEN